ncbi:MAG: phosphate acyltransferase PlsX [Lentisphaeria bacterium]|nr:phosphate acyltransferase PlsX [Lentisphaeria bacterium]NQZ70474.1 phosphate acyltransferase PlsX [Lentisphaeria bacterium]
MKIAVDAMGGDFGLENPIAGVKLALEEMPDMTIVLTGREDEIKAELVKLHIADDKRIEIVHASQVVDMCEPATVALRQKKDSSITIASKLLKNKEVDAIVSAGHTGACVASTVVQNRTLEGIDRPAIATVFPSNKGKFVILDVGATMDCKPINLAQFAILGEIYSKLILKVENPRVGILSVGAESGKGNELSKKAFDIIQKMPVNFVGNIEGSDMFNGNVDVVICDGFVGNVVLKSCESIAKTITSLLKEGLTKNPMRMTGALLSRKAFEELKVVTDKDQYGGAPLLGVNGTCIIGHGSSSPIAIKNAIRIAYQLVDNNVNGLISQKISEVNWDEIIHFEE